MKMLDIPKEEMMTSGSTTCNQGPPKVSCTVINLFSNSFFFKKKVTLTVKDFSAQPCPKYTHCCFTIIAPPWCKQEAMEEENIVAFIFQVDYTESMAHPIILGEGNTLRPSQRNKDSLNFRQPISLSIKSFQQLPISPLFHSQMARWLDIGNGDWQLLRKMAILLRFQGICPQGSHQVMLQVFAMWRAAALTTQHLQSFF